MLGCIRVCNFRLGNYSYAVNRFTRVQKKAFISVVAAIGVHGCVFALWILLIIWDLPLFAYDALDKEPKPEPEPEVVIMMTPELADPSTPPPPPPLAPEEKPPVPPPQPLPPDVAKQEPLPKEEVDEEKQALPEQKSRFARTSADQEGKPDEPTEILGERDTRAASENAPVPGADPNLPSQDGRNPLRPGHVETVDRDYLKGSLGADKTGEHTELPQEATASADNQEIDEAPKVEQDQPDQAESAKTRDEHLEIGELHPTHDDGTGRKEVEDQPKAEESPKEKPNQGAKREGRGEATEQTPKKDGFKGLSRKTKITGSISRRGKSALNVKNSPLGRYQALISKSVERQWRLKCEQHRDHIVPGVLPIRFYVDKSGRVSGIKFIGTVGGSYIMRGFTQRAIREAKLPRMPKAVIEELDGEELELIYNFYF